MTGIDTKLWNLQDMIRKLGFMPEEHGDREYREDWYIKQVNGGTRNVRAVVCPDDGHAVDIYSLDRHFCEEWHARFSPGTPHATIRATLRAAISA
jgi:hypothetical protein